VGRELRQYKRFPADEPVLFCTVKTMYGTEETKQTGQIRDISTSGLFVETETLPPVEEIVMLEFKFKRSGKYRLLGRVIWIGEKQGTTGMGIAFLPPSGEPPVLTEERQDPRDR
jgi:hypothetical protein